MKKNFVFIFEFEADISEKVSKGCSKDDRFFAALFKEVLKNDKVIRNLYRLMLMSDFEGGNHIYETERYIHDLGMKDELEIIKPVLRNLSDDAIAHFLNIFESKDERREKFFDRFFSHFGTLRVIKSNFMERK
jgi:ribosomal 50S subunit-associated protein YjgA (DUF615 family)